MGTRSAIGLTLAASLLAGAAIAQENPAVSGPPVQGPLVSPADAAMPAVKPSRKAKSKAHRHAAKVPVAETTDAATAAQPNSPSPDRAAPPTSRAEHATAADPMDFSFKWHGANDSAEQTRVQNYNGDAAGTGAALGLNLHF